MVSLHTSPLEQPGTGDAGGMNVYVLELSRNLVRQGVEVDVFTRATASGQGIVEVEPGLRVVHVHAGPLEGLAKERLHDHLPVFTRALLDSHDAAGGYDLIHSHYWLSGLVGVHAREHWGVPLVHTMHTMARVKNALLAEGDTPEPDVRIDGEQLVVDTADALIANTHLEAAELVKLYAADPARACVVHPGVDLERFRPGHRVAARRHFGIGETDDVILFAGRIQPLKAPDVLLRAIAVIVRRDPTIRERLIVPIVGGPSGSGLDRPDALARLARDLGVDDVVRFEPPATREQLAGWFCAADVVAVPSYNESFGLVALEAQACGTPVVAAAVGGLTTAVAHDISGLLVEGHAPEEWAEVLHTVLLDDALRERLAHGAREHAADFSWERTAQHTLRVYEQAVRRG